MGQDVQVQGRMQQRCRAFSKMNLFHTKYDWYSSRYFTYCIEVLEKYNIADMESITNQ